MSMSSIYITKKCICDKSNWVIYRTKNSYRNPNSSYLIHCNKCGSQWYSKAKYINDLPFAK